MSIRVNGQIIASNGETFKRDIVESYHEGTSWYRVYSDGWIEQGGQTPSDQKGTVTFLKDYTSGNLPAVVMSPVTATSQDTFIICGVKNVSYNEFTYESCGVNNSSGQLLAALGTCIKKWYACGY